MGRPPINMLVIISSTQDSRFAKPRNFRSIPAASKATGISLRAVRNAHHSGRTSIKMASGEVYTLKWMELVTPLDTSKCYYCHRDLTVKDKSTWFHMERKDMGLQGPGCSPIKQYPKTFTSLYAA